MRIVFFGTPAWAIPSLEALVGAGHDLAALVTAPDKARGRSRTPQPSPLKARALELGLGPILQPTSLRPKEARAAILDAKAEAFVVVAYGRILPGRLLDAPLHGAINLHFSLLPRHRGASPVQHTLLLGDERAGVSTMRMERGLDTGPVYLQRAAEIEPGEDAASLGARLAELGAPLLVETLAGLEEGTLAARPQDDAAATLAPPLSAPMGRVDFGDALDIERRVRAFSPWPPVVCAGPKGVLRLRRVEALDDATRDLAGAALGGADLAGEARPQAGTILGASGEAVDVACARGVLRVFEVQPAGRKAMSAGAALAGRHLELGALLEPLGEEGDGPASAR